MVSEEEREDVRQLLTDALPELCAELSGRSTEVEAADVMALFTEHGLELRTAAPVDDQ